MKILDILRRQLDLKLADSEEVELQQIDDKIARLPYEAPATMLALHQESWNMRRAQTVDAYRLKREAQEALALAEASTGDREAWDKAYRAAQASDVIVQALLVEKLRDILNPTGGLFAPGSHDRKLFVACFSIILLNWSLKALTSIDREEINRFTEDLTAFVMIPVMVLTMLSQRTDLDSYLHIVSFYRDSGDEVQRLALEAGVELGLAGKRLADSNSLIGQLVNIRDNAKTLAAINDPDAPDELCCVYGKTILTDPVYSEQNPDRMERSMILAWLKIRGTHPSTGTVLYADDLKRDFGLKRRADAYVDEQVAKKALLQLSRFSEALVDSDGDNDDNDVELGELRKDKFV
ncbi:MAG: hypothetical protein K0U37_00450 [Gammaproteobacteria bacterium]|nr:hypothetical protein [Gammaproteobacteria bacterium]